MRKVLKSKYAFVLLLFLYTGITYAQTDQHGYSLQNVIPPSPNASSLGKYANWPVNLFTGVPQINIPIYELKGRNITVPISLSYHASGIKVGEHASSVGLGWSLQAGGLITRSLRGRPDEEPSAGYLDLRTRYNDPADLSSGSIATGGSAYSDSMLQIAVARGDMDSEPDLFMFSAMGQSFKFYFSDDTIVTQPYSNNRLSVDWSSNTWTVIFEDGTKLVFGGTGCTETTATPSLDVYSYTSSWYLKTITSPQGEVITFTYFGSAPITLDSYFYQSDYKLNYVDIAYLLYGTPETNKAGVSRAETQNVTMLNIATIESDNCKVYFDTSNARTDLPGACKVKSVRIYSKLRSAYLKTFKFYYTYSAAASGNVYTGGYTTPNYRLKLDTLEEVPSDNGQHKYWKFEYNPKALPSRKSFAQDYWGYFNGATSNTNFLPPDVNFDPGSHPWANRSADSASMTAEMLTKITYPTGGYSQFTFEPNSYPATEEQFGIINEYPHIHMQSTGGTRTQTTTFTLTKPQYFYFTAKAVYYGGVENDYGTTYQLDTAKLINSAGTVILSKGFKAVDNNVDYTSPSIMLAAGTYTFRIGSPLNAIDFDGTTSQSNDLNCSFSYIGSLGNKLVNHPVGGVRIRSIFDYDGVNTSNTIKKYYEYDSAFVIAPVDSTVDFSPGVTDRTWDCDLTLTGCSVPGCLAYSVIYYSRNSSTKFALGSIQGGTVGYGKVTEKLGANAENGKTVYHYTTPGDINVSASKGLPYPETISMDYERGLLTEKDVYTAANVLVAKSKEDYQYIRRNAIKTFKLGYNYNCMSSCQHYDYLSYYINRQFYQDLTEQVQHTRTIQISYNTATADSLSDTITYFYDADKDMLPVRTVTTSSKGDSLVTYTRMALEKSDINSSFGLSTTASTAIDSMLARNMLRVPIASEQYINHMLINKTLTNFKVQTTNILTPDNVMVQNNHSPIETRLQFNSFDSKGNLREQQKSSDVKHAYIWDYNTTYPIAEVVNSSATNSAYSSFETTSGGGWTPASTTRDTTSAITGKKCYDLNNGIIYKTSLSTSITYVVSYWSKTGSAYSVTGSTSSKQGKTINGWTYFEHTVTGVTADTVSGSGLIDELRLYPATAQMATYTYEPLIGVSSQCDINNRITYYEYDGLQRLVVVRDQDRNVIKKICYAYAGQAVTACDNDIISLSSDAATTGFKATLTNIYTGAVTVFNLPSGTTANLGPIQEGLYNITISKTGNSTNYQFSICSGLYTSGLSATFYNVSVTNGSCNNIVVTGFFY